MDMATLGIAIKTFGVDQASMALQALSVNSDKAEKAVTTLSAAAGRAESDLRKEATTANAVSQAMVSLAGSSTRADQAHTKFALSTAGVGKAAQVAEHDLKNMGYQIVDVIQGLLTGQRPMQVFMQQAGQIGQIAATSGVGVGGWAKAISGLFSPAVLAGGAVLGLGAAAAYVAVEMHKGANEQINFNNALKLTGGYAATSGTALFSMADSSAKAFGVTAQSVRDLELQLVRSGQVGSSTMGQLTQASLLYAKATGGDAADAVKVFMPLLGDTTNAALALNNQFHALTFAQLENIQTLQQQGDKQGAVRAAMDALLPSMQHQDQNLGILETSWRGVGLMIASATDSLMSWGRASGGSDMDKADAKLAALIQRRDALQGELNGSNSLPGKAALYGTYGAGADAHLAQITQQVSGLNGQIRAYQELDKAVTQFNDHEKANRDLEQNAASIVLGRQSQLTKLMSEQSTLTQAIAAGVGNVAKEQTALLAVQKEIANLNKPEVHRASQQERDYQAAAKSAQAYADALRLETQQIGMNADALKLLATQRAMAVAPSKDLADDIWKAYEQYEHKAAMADRASPLDDPKLGNFKIRDVQDDYGKMPAVINSVSDAFRGFGGVVADAATRSDNFWSGMVNGIDDLARAFEAKEINKLFSIIGDWAGCKAQNGGGAGWSLAADFFSPTPNATGGVYSSPSLHSYANGVYDKPKTFAFAKGAGIFAEAGPEAIMPLSRGADGKLGVAAHGRSPGGTSAGSTISQADLHAVATLVAKAIHSKLNEVTSNAKSYSDRQINGFSRALPKRLGQINRQGT